MEQEELDRMREDFVERLYALYSPKTTDDLLEAYRAPLDETYSIAGHDLRQSVREVILISRGVDLEEKEEDR